MPEVRSRSTTGGRLARFVAAVGALAAVVAGATPAAGAPGNPKPAPTTVTWGIGPANARGVDGRAVLSYTISPGSSTQDRVALVNLGPKPLRIDVYAADAVNAPGGAIAFAPKAAPGRDARTWITIDLPGGAHSIVLRPHSVQVVPVAISIPADATPGDHLAAIMTSLTARAAGNGRARENLEQRVGLRTFFRIAGELRPQLAVTGLAATYHDDWNPFGAGSVTISYRVKNTGNVLLSGKERIKVSGLCGDTGSRTALVDVPTLLQGGSAPVTAVVHDVWPELYMHAEVSITPAGVPGAANPELHAASARASFVAVPWALLVLLVLLGGVAFLLVRWRRRLAGSARHRRTEKTKTAAEKELAGAK